MNSSSKNNINDLLKRFLVIITGIPIIIYLLSKPHTSTILLQVAHILCIIEYLNLLLPKLKSCGCSSTAFLVLSYSVPSILISISNIPQFLISISSIVCYILLTASKTKKEDDLALSFIIGWIYISFGFYALIQISNASFEHSIMTMSIVWICDTGALLTGRYLGNKKRGLVWLKGLSENKTLEGFIGGILTGTITCILLPSIFSYYNNTDILFQYSNLSYVGSIRNMHVRRGLVGFCTSFFAIIGDLLESLLKRKAGVKDSGALLPGHGGILDRMDSLLFAGIWYYHCCL